MSRLKTIIEEVFDESFEEVVAAQNFRQLESWDSLNYIKLVVAIQSEFSIELGPEEIKTMMSVKAINEVLTARGIDG